LLFMKCQRCGDCCQETEMLLSEKDILRLEKKGFRKETFVRFDKEGYAILRNRRGHCVFFNPEKRRCVVYACRPEGCRFFPVILDENKGVVADTICRAHLTVTDEEKRSRGKGVITLLELIDSEARKRIS